LKSREKASRIIVREEIKTSEKLAENKRKSGVQALLDVVESL